MMALAEVWQLTQREPRQEAVGTAAIAPGREDEGLTLGSGHGDLWRGMS